MDLKDKVVLVTGASGGIGRGIALAFAREGAKLVAAYRRDESGARETVRLVEELGAKCVSFSGELSDEGEVSRLFEFVMKTYGTLDVLVNNAGKSEPKGILAANKADWLKALDDSFFTAALCCKAALQIMKEKGSGKVINMSSINGLPNVARPGNVTYSVAKAAIISLTKILAQEFAPHIQVNAVAPGKTMTDYWSRVDKEFAQRALHDVPLKRFIDVEEVARTFVFIAENDAITGEVVVVDGGFSLREYA